MVGSLDLGCSCSNITNFSFRNFGLLSFGDEGSKSPKKSSTDTLLSLSIQPKKTKSKRKNQLLEKEVTAKEEKKVTNELMVQYESEQKKYSHLQKDLPKKGAMR